MQVELEGFADYKVKVPLGGAVGAWRRGWAGDWTQLGMNTVAGVCNLG